MARAETVKSEKGNSDQPGWPLKSTQYRNESLELVHHLSYVQFVTTLLFPFPLHSLRFLPLAVI